MQPPAWQTLALKDGVLSEPMPGNQGSILWLPGETGKDFDQWERIGPVPGAGIFHRDGLCATAATSIQVRRPVRGLIGTLFAGFRSAPGERSWTMPNGDVAEQVGARQTGLILVWPESDLVVLDEARIRSSWPQGQRVSPIGQRLFLVSGIEPPKEAPAPALPSPPSYQPQQTAEQLSAAEQLLAAARQSGNRRREIGALTDLGVTCQIVGDGKRALAVLEEALALARQFGDASQENDVIGNLGVVVLTTGQRARGFDLMQEALKRTRAVGDRFGEKMALERLGEANSRLREPQQALEFFELAHALALELGDKRHAAELLWQQGIQYAELGQRDRAIAKAETAIDLLRTLGNPQAQWLTEHLRRYCTGEAGSPLQEGIVSRSAPPGVSPGGQAAADKQKAGPGLMRMAISSAKSIATYLASGLKTVPPVVHQKRVETCATCEHHTGLRCKLCGCFTNTKAWLPHERCPIDKWPAQ